MGLLFVLHGVVLGRWGRQLEARSSQTTSAIPTHLLRCGTDHAILVPAAALDTDTLMLQQHDRHSDVHMGDTKGKAPSTRRFGFGTRQGCSVFVMKYCVYSEVCGHEASSPRPTPLRESCTVSA